MKKDFVFLSVFLFIMAGIWTCLAFSFPYSNDLLLKIAQIVGFTLGFFIWALYATAFGCMSFTFDDSLNEVRNHHRVEEQDIFMQEAIREVEEYLKQ